MPSQALVPTVIHLSSFSLTSSPHKQNTSVLLQWLHSWSLLGEMVGAWGVFGELWPDYFMHHEFTLGLLGLIAPLRGEERGWVGVLSSPSSHRCIITVRLLYLAAADAWRRLSSAGPGWCRLECDLCVYACVYGWRQQHKHQLQDLMLHSGPVGNSTTTLLTVQISSHVVNMTCKCRVGNLTSAHYTKQEDIFTTKSNG